MTMRRGINAAHLHSPESYVLAEADLSPLPERFFGADGDPDGASTDVRRACRARIENARVLQVVEAVDPETRVALRLNKLAVAVPLVEVAPRKPGAPEGAARDRGEGT
jgi:hypothetical protein